MSQQHINTGSSPDSGTGDPLRTCFIKAEENFNELYDSLAPLSPFTGSAVITGSVIITGSLHMYGADSKLTTELLNVSQISTPIGSAKIEFQDSLILFFIDNVEYMRVDGSTSPNSVTINNNNEDIDFTVRGSSTTTLSVNGGTSKVGIGNTNPSYDLDVNGAVRALQYLVDGGALPTEDPGVEGQFFQTSSQYLGGTSPYYQVVCISEG